MINQNASTRRICIDFYFRHVGHHFLFAGYL
jgi:hypothetical protein